MEFLVRIKDKDLQEIFEVKPLGHRIAILNTGVREEHQTSSRSTHTSTNHISHKPPQLKPTMTTSSFRAFVDHWSVYKKLVGRPVYSSDGAAHIFSLACSDHPEIRQTIANHKPEHLTLTEVEYIEMIRKLLTARSTPETYRNKFFYMSQTPSETCQ